VIGRFTSFDSFEASPSDPASLHKYNYGNGDPVNNIDPTGMFSVANVVVGVGVGLALVALGGKFYTYAGIFRGSLLGPRQVQGTAGADISGHLVNLRREMMTRIASLDAATFNRLAAENEDPAKASQNWDVTELYEAGGGFIDGGTGRDRFRTGSSVPGTVTVKGRAHEAPEVNYFLYGTIIRAVDERLGKTIGAGSTEWAEVKIRTHRAARAFGDGTNGRIAWFRAGYYDDFSKAEPAALPNVSTTGATPYSESLFGWWGTGYDIQVRARGN